MRVMQSQMKFPLPRPCTSNAKCLMLHKRTDGGNRVLYHSGLQALDDVARGIRRHVLTNEELRAKAYGLYGQGMTVTWE